MTQNSLRIAECRRVSRQVGSTLDDVQFAKDNLNRMTQQFPPEFLLNADLRNALFAVKIMLDAALRWGVILQAFTQNAIKRQERGAQDGVAGQGQKG